MPQHSACRLGTGGDNQVRNFDAAMMKSTLLRQFVLNLQGSMKLARPARQLMESLQFCSQLLVGFQITVDAKSVPISD